MRMWGHERGVATDRVRSAGTAFIRPPRLWPPRCSPSWLTRMPCPIGSPLQPCVHSQWHTVGRPTVHYVAPVLARPDAPYWRAPSVERRSGRGRAGTEGHLRVEGFDLGGKCGRVGDRNRVARSPQGPRVVTGHLGAPNASRLCRVDARSRMRGAAISGTPNPHTCRTCRAARPAMRMCTALAPDHRACVARATSRTSRRRFLRLLVLERTWSARGRRGCVLGPGMATGRPPNRGHPVRDRAEFERCSATGRASAGRLGDRRPRLALQGEQVAPQRYPRLECVRRRCGGGR